MYGPAISDPWYVAGVMIMSSVCPRLCVGMLTCCFRLKASSMLSRVCILIFIVIYMDVDVSHDYQILVFGELFC